MTPAVDSTCTTHHICACNAERMEWQGEQIVSLRTLLIRASDLLSDLYEQASFAIGDGMLESIEEMNAEIRAVLAVEEGKDGA